MARAPRRAPVSHADEREHRRQLANTANELARDAEQLEERVAELENDLEALAQDVEDLTGRVDDIEAQAYHEPCYIESPEAKKYPVIPEAKFPFVINETTTLAGAGTGTVQWRINDVELGGSSNSASTTKETQTHTSANVVAVGDEVSINVSSISGLEDLATIFKYTRTHS